MVGKPIILKPIPPLATNEKASFRPISLEDYIQSPDVESGNVEFSAELIDGKSLPAGLICTADGLLGGLPAEGTAGTYEIQIEAKNNHAESLVVPVTLTIGLRPESEDPLFLTNFKSKVWEALGKDLPLPNLGDILDRPITPIEIYYLLQRFAVLTIWDVYNLDSPAEKTLLKLEGVNPHYQIFDRGSCLVAAPISLYSHERTLADALQASKIMAQEVYKRGWTIEFAGFNKMVRAAWIELQNLAVLNGKSLEILHYTPSSEDVKVYEAQAKSIRPTI